jgi:hypothetical protein
MPQRPAKDAVWPIFVPLSGMILKLVHWRNFGKARESDGYARIADWIFFASQQSHEG